MCKKMCNERGRALLGADFGARAEVNEAPLWPEFDSSCDTERLDKFLDALRCQFGIAKLELEKGDRVVIVCDVATSVATYWMPSSRSRSGVPYAPTLI